MINIPSPKVSKLDLSNQKLQEFPMEVLQLKNLKKLNLKGNNIKSIPKEIEKLKYLKVLDLSNNQINNFQSKICYLNNLKILNLNNNLIKTIPTQIEKLSELQILHLGNNSILKFPKTFENLSNLKELNISKNSFRVFPNEILKFDNLQTLWLNNLALQNFPVSEILNLKNLKSIYCFSVKNELSSDENYLLLSKTKGNSLYKLQLLKNMKKNPFLSTSPELNPSNLKKNKIFISYSHKDTQWLERVRLNLKVLTYNDYDFELWDDTKLKGGDKWKEEIVKSLNNSGIAILLVSTEFLASDFIRNEELPTLLKNAETLGTKILPLIIGHSLFTKDKMLSQFQAANDPKRPLNSLKPFEWEKELAEFSEAILELLKS